MAARVRSVTGRLVLRPCRPVRAADRCAHPDDTSAGPVKNFRLNGREAVYGPASERTNERTNERCRWSHAYSTSMRIRTVLGPPLPHEIVRDTATALVLSNGASSQRDSTCGNYTADCSPGSYARKP
jgi:hypothetical protein